MQIAPAQPRPAPLRYPTGALAPDLAARTARLVEAALRTVTPVPVINMAPSRAIGLLDGSRRFRISDSYRPQLEQLGAADPGEPLDGATFATLRFAAEGTTIGDLLATSSAPLGMRYYGPVSVVLAPDALQGARLLPTLSVSAAQARAHALSGMRATTDLRDVLVARLAMDNGFLQQPSPYVDARRAAFERLIGGPTSAAVDAVRAWLLSPDRVRREHGLEVILRNVSPSAIAAVVVEPTARPDDASAVVSAAAARGIRVFDRAAAEAATSAFSPSIR